MYIPVHNKATFNTVCFDENPVTCQYQKENKELKDLNFALLLLFLSHIMAGKGLSERLKKERRFKSEISFHSDWPCGRFLMTECCLHRPSQHCSARWKQNQHTMLLQRHKTIAGGTALRHSTEDSRFKPQASFRYHPPPPQVEESVSIPWMC